MREVHCARCAARRWEAGRRWAPCRSRAIGRRSVAIHRQVRRVPEPRSATRRAGPPSGRRSGCRKIRAGLAAGSGSGVGERSVPFLTVGDDVQESLAVGHVVRVARLDRFPGVPAEVGCRKTEHPGQPGFAVGAVIGQGLAGPLAGDQDAAPGVAEVLAAVGLALAGARSQAGPGVLGLDAVAEPVRAGRRARFVPQRVGQPSGVVGLGVGGGLVAVAELLGQVLGEVADAPAGIRVIRRARPGRRTGYRTGPRATARRRRRWRRAPGPRSAAPRRCPGRGRCRCARPRPAWRRRRT